jgi:energy-converting hydrogenase Eha subunit A
MTCLLEDRFPKAVPYVYQVAAIIGFGHLVVSKMFLLVFDMDLRFWYNFFYLAVGLANVVAVNLYLAVVKKSWMLAKVWSASVTFPTVFISVFFVYNYGSLQVATFPLLTVDMILVLSVAVLGIVAAVLLSPRISKEQRGR